MTDSDDSTRDSDRRDDSALNPRTGAGADSPGSESDSRWDDLPPRRLLRASSRPNFRGDSPTSSSADAEREPDAVRPTPATEHHNTRDADREYPSRRELREQREHRRREADAYGEEHGASSPDEAEEASDVNVTSASTAATTPAALAGASAAAYGAAGADSAPTGPSGYGSRASDRDEDAQPRHSQRSRDGFPSVVLWTILGTALPGLAMIRRNRKSVLSWLLLACFVLGILALILTAVFYGPTAFASRIVSSPKILRFVSVVLIIGFFIWVLVILRSFAVSKRGFRMPKAHKTLSWILVASLIVIVGVPLGVGAAYANVTASTLAKVFGDNGGRVLKRQDLWADKPRINVFLIGQDSSDTREGIRPDTMLVASIDTRTGETTLISVPRNLAFPVFPKDSKLAERFPNGFRPTGDPTEDLINAVWDWAANSPDEVGDPHGLEPGMYATIQAVEGSLGINLDYWTAVNMQGFSDLISAIGGVELDVERPIPMGGGNNQFTGAKNKIFGWIDPGPQRLEGKKALWYTRSRDGADNYDRMCRQQRFLKAALDQVSPQELAVQYPKLAASASQNIRTDIPLSDLSAFTDLAMVMSQHEVKSAQITNDVTSTLSPDYDELQKWVQDQINPKKPSQKVEKNKGDEDAADAPDAETPKPTPTAEDTTPPGEGIETSDGKCYPRGYTPGDPWPGYPHNDKMPGGANSEGGADE